MDSWADDDARKGPATDLINKARDAADVVTDLRIKDMDNFNQKGAKNRIKWLNDALGFDVAVKDGTFVDVTKMIPGRVAEVMAFPGSPWEDHVCSCSGRYAWVSRVCVRGECFRSFSDLEAGCAALVDARGRSLVERLETQLCHDFCNRSCTHQYSG